MGIGASHSVVLATLGERTLGPPHPCTTLGNLLNFAVPSFLTCHARGWSWTRQTGAVRFQVVNVFKVLRTALVQGRCSVNAAVLIATVVYETLSWTSQQITKMGSRSSRVSQSCK